MLPLVLTTNLGGSKKNLEIYCKNIFKFLPLAMN